MRRFVMMLSIVAALLVFSGCQNPCKKLAAKVCKLKGKTSKACLNAKKQVKKSGNEEMKLQCKQGLDLISIIEEKKKKEQP